MTADARHWHIFNIGDKANGFFCACGERFRPRETPLVLASPLGQVALTRLVRNVGDKIEVRGKVVEVTR